MKLSNILAAAAFAVAMPFAASAAPFADCAGLTFDDGGGDGDAYTVFSGSRDCAFTVVGSDTGSGDGILTTVSGTALEDIYVSGVYIYQSNDEDGSSFDPFGFFVGDEQTQLSSNDLDQGEVEKGMYGFMVAAGETFGWYIFAEDDDLGAAKARVYADFELAPIPLPASALLMLGALGGLVVVRRRANA